MGLVTDKVNMRSFENNPVDLLAIDADWRDCHQIARMYEKVKIEFFASYVLVDSEILIPKSNGSGAIGEVLSTPLIGEPLIGEPLIGYTQTFISFGAFDNKEEAENLLKYIKTKFARTMLGTMKITQDNATKSVWRNVPLQDFTPNSDIDWSRSIVEIDQQLYAKYGLDQHEIDFIETRVKEME